MPIDTLQIQCFISVATHLNFTKAANALFLSQPAISRKVAALEAELGIVLIDRSNRELKLTKDGEAFKEFFSTFMQQMDTLTAQAKRKGQESREEIRIGIFEGWNLSAFLRELLTEFRLKHGHIAFIIDTCSEKDLISGLKNRKYDAVILLKISIKCAINRGLVSEVEVYDFLKVHKSLYYSTYNPLSEKENLCFEDFRDQTLYTFKSDIVPFDIISNKALFAKHGIDPPIKTLSTLDAIINAISTGGGFALLDHLARIRDNHEFRSLELEESHGVSIAIPKENTSEARALLLEYCRKVDFNHLWQSKTKG